MNLLVNPGFDALPDWVGWNLSATGTALECAGAARSLPNSAELTAAYYLVNLPPAPPVYVDLEGEVVQEIEARLGKVYVISAWVKDPTPWGPIVLTVKGVEIARVEADTGGDWVLLSGLWTADAEGAAGVAVQALHGTGEGIGQWLVDDAEVALARGGYIAYSALVTALKDITGSGAGYYTDFGARVYPKLVRPETGMKMPFICVIPDPDQPADEDRNTYLMARWRFRMTAFVSGSESMVETTSTAKLVLDAYDDLIRAVRPYSTAGVQPLESAGVADVTAVGKELFAGVPDGYAYGEATLIVDLSVPLTADNLGPAGV